MMQTSKIAKYSRIIDTNRDLWGLKKPIFFIALYVGLDLKNDEKYFGDRLHSWQSKSNISTNFWTALF
jgi:hypothetical protein